MNNERNDAFFLIDDSSHVSWGYPHSGWDYDSRGDKDLKNGGNVKCIISSVETEPTTFIRDITEQKNGKITFETMFIVEEGNGFYMQFGDVHDALFSLKFLDEVFYAKDKKVCDVDYKNRHYIKVVLNLDTKKALVAFDRKLCGEFDFFGNAKVFSRYSCGFVKEDIGSAVMCYCTKCYKNYYVNDYSIFTKEGEMPYDYEVKTENGAKVGQKPYVKGKSNCAYFADLLENSSAEVYKKFEKSRGNVCFEGKYLLPNENVLFSVSLMNDKVKAISIGDCGINIGKKDGEILKNHHLNVWQTLRIEADTRNSKALIKLNGKKVATIDFDEKSDYFDGLQIEFIANGCATVFFSDLFVFEIPDEPENYVPEPIIPEKKGDYYVGMNICSLWRTGDHMGWDCITPFPEIEPLLGYYDEGLAEVADWEIKFMAEHGIDFELYCWYSSEENSPLKYTQLSSAIHGGHFNAKYSDKVKLALLWEAANAAHPKGSEAFRKYIVPYWLDYFFSDPRYMRIDNKAIMSVFGAGQLIKDFGSPEGVRTEFDYLRSEVKKLGFDDLIIMACSGADQVVADCGFDAVHAYNWGKTGCEVDYTKNCITSNIDKKLIHVVPTVSTGFNNVGWASTRSPNMTTEDMKTMLTWFRDDILSKNDKDSWKSKLCMLSTWNEYGEGTYISPTGLNRFGYLDSVRSVFMKDVPHEDVAPDDEEKKRLCYLHPIGRSKIARLDRLKFPLCEDNVLHKWTFNSQEDVDKWNFSNFETLEVKDGVLHGTTKVYDPKMTLKEDYIFNADDVSHIKVTIQCYKPVKQLDCVEAYFSTTQNKEIGWDCHSVVLTDPNNMAELTLPMYKNTNWRGKITSFRIDPIWGEGEFFLKSIELMAAVDHVNCFINENSLYSGIYPDEEEGEIYIPFSPRSLFARETDSYFEWTEKKNLTFFRKDKVLKLTLGSDIANIDGENFRLSKPLYAKDGLPMLPIYKISDFFELDLVKNGRNLSITTI